MALSPAVGGCPWPIDEACLGDEWTALTADQQERAVALASSALRQLTAYRVGGCPTTVRPCVQEGCWGYWDWSGGQFNPHITSEGFWVNSCGCGGDCSTGCEVVLPSPVGSVTEVKVDGAVLAEADYQLQRGNILVWIGGGECPFPKAQDLSLADTEVGTFSVTFQNSYPVDNLGATAAGLLALEFSRACKPKSKCSLPRGVTDVVRNGVTFTIEAGLFPNGSTGIDFVDSWVRLWNPDARTQQTRVYYPGSSSRVV